MRPSDPGYDAHVLAHIKTKIVVDPVKGCWLWQGFIQPERLTDRGFRVGGYGSIGYRGRNISVHRTAVTCKTCLRMLKAREPLSDEQQITGEQR